MEEGKKRLPGGIILLCLGADVCVADEEMWGLLEVRIARHPRRGIGWKHREVKSFMKSLIGSWTGRRRRRNGGQSLQTETYNCTLLVEEAYPSRANGELQNGKMLRPFLFVLLNEG